MPSSSFITYTSFLLSAVLVRLMEKQQYETASMLKLRCRLHFSEQTYYMNFFFHWSSQISPSSKNYRYRKNKTVFQQKTLSLSEDVKCLQDAVVGRQA